MIKTGINSIDRDSYFVRLTDKKDHYVHFEGDDNSGDNIVYRIKEGPVGAAIWLEDRGKMFIKQSGANNFELVKVIDVLGSDESLN